MLPVWKCLNCHLRSETLEDTDTKPLSIDCVGEDTHRAKTSIVIDPVKSALLMGELYGRLVFFSSLFIAMTARLNGSTKIHDHGVKRRITKTVSSFREYGSYHIIFRIKIPKNLYFCPRMSVFQPPITRRPIHFSSTARAK
jgi:hypothetical protein